MKNYKLYTSFYYRNTKSFFCILFLCFFIFFPIKNNFAWGQSFLILNSLDTFYANNSIQLEFVFKPIYLNELEKLLKSGTAINIDCKAELLEMHTLRSNKILSSYTKGWQLRFEPLTREFLLFSAEEEFPIRKRSLENLLESLFQHITLIIQDIPPLDKEKTYKIFCSFGLRHADVPPWLEKALFFWEWDIASDIFETNLNLTQ